MLPLFSVVRTVVLATSLPLAFGCAVIDRTTGESEARSLRQTGVPAWATILRLWDTGITVNDDRVVGMEVEVRPSPPTEGAPFRAVIPKSRISRLDIPRVQPGETVAVRYDPNNSSRVALDDPPFPPAATEGRTP
jgi:uncharacterized protein DUF3592